MDTLSDFSPVIGLMTEIVQHALPINTKSKYTEADRAFLTEVGRHPRYADMMIGGLGKNAARDEIISDVRLFMSDGYKACYKALSNIYPNHLFKLKWIDGLQIHFYNSELGVAVMFYENHHYEYCPSVHKTIEEYNTQTNNDEFIMRHCVSQGIKLVITPYYVRLECIEDFIRRALMG